MNLQEALGQIAEERRSIRRFQDRSVPEDVIKGLVYIGGWAPSASNRQDWRVKAVVSNDMKQKMAAAVAARWGAILENHADEGYAGELSKYAANFSWFAHAPAVLTVSCKCPETFLEHLTGERASDISGGKLSAGMAAQNIMLAAHAAGLGSCCLTGALAAESELKTLLGIGRRRSLVCLIGLGYPDEEPAKPSRKTVDAILEFVK